MSDVFDPVYISVRLCMLLTDTSCTYIDDGMATKTRYMVPVPKEAVDTAKAIVAHMESIGVPTTSTAILRSAMEIGIAELAKKFHVEVKKVALPS